VVVPCLRKLPLLGTASSFGSHVKQTCAWRCYDFLHRCVWMQHCHISSLSSTVYSTGQHVLTQALLAVFSCFATQGKTGSREDLDYDPLLQWASRWRVVRIKRYVYVLQACAWLETCPVAGCGKTCLANSVTLQNSGVLFDREYNDASHQLCPHLAALDYMTRPHSSSRRLLGVRN
jgi:hypothetical protein